MKRHSYKTITGRRLNLEKLSAEERTFLRSVAKTYRGRPEWTAFASWWMSAFGKSGLEVDSVIHRLCQDLEARLGIAQGKVSPPDYRDYVADLIEERFGSRYRFCKETGVDPGHLSRVLAGRAEVSLPLLERILRTLGATLIVQPRELLRERASPEEAGQLLAGVLPPAAP